MKPPWGSGAVEPPTRVVFPRVASRRWGFGESGGTSLLYCSPSLGVWVGAMGGSSQGHSWIGLFAGTGPCTSPSSLSLTFLVQPPSGMGLRGAGAPQPGVGSGALPGRLLCCLPPSQPSAEERNKVKQTFSLLETPSSLFSW